MKEQPYNKDLRANPISNFFRVGCVGSVSITTATPMMNGINHLLAIKRAEYLIRQGLPAHEVPKFTVRRAFDGALCYNMSVYPMIGISIPLNQFILKQLKPQETEPSIFLRCIAAGISGFIAGAVGALPEGVAQAQQLHTTKPSAITVIKKVVTNNGFFALGRGTVPVMFRQMQFSIGYLGWMPFFSSYFRKKTSETWLADFFAAITCGVMIGPLTAPWNTLRFERQKYFDQAGAAQSFASIFQQAIKSGSSVKLSNGWKPRIIMSTSSMFILHKGKEIYDWQIDQEKPALK